MDLIQAIDIASSGLTAQRTQLDVTAMNLANAKTTRTMEGGPYRRKEPIFAEAPMSPFASLLDRERNLSGVRVEEVRTQDRPFRRVYEPGHPDADEEGYVNYPDINVMEEMTAMLSAMRAYEANVSTITTAKNMFAKALEIGR
ncbi:flagellar basal-body rod protein FlgC [Thermodesulfomicrobium sp. WS]|uniref:flagellar basal body rod protein FlgC n=1 Tax=Thermodesulfomicrobium sp. WS TaxID=3004129 RepID=UPI002493868D|nr:flagellar basal body rod protein FlgC [Thermodesulfomicrobium sp. WS]BDV02105.1 flagellar basal-body rod protein FlgC [Thermodesulfomicrobium sp. WS]